MGDFWQILVLPLKEVALVNILNRTGRATPRAGKRAACCPEAGAMAMDGMTEVDIMSQMDKDMAALEAQMDHHMGLAVQPPFRLTKNED